MGYANIIATFMYDDKTYAKGKGRDMHMSTIRRHEMYGYVDLHELRATLS